MSLKYTIRNFIRKHIPESAVRRYKLMHSTTYPIVKNPLEFFQLIYHIKDDTWEPLHMPEIFEMSKPYDLEVFHGRQDILLIPDAQVFDNSDIILAKNGVVWDKYYTRSFSKVQPMDRNYLAHTIDEVTLRNSEHNQNISGECISMLGTFEGVWSHFLVQFLPKLYYAEEAGLLDKEGVTLLLPQYKDKQIEQLVNDVLCKHPNLVVIRVKDAEDRLAYHCEKLYYIPTASNISNHTYFESFYDSVIPYQVREILKKNVVDHYVSKIRKNETKYEKIYFIRRSWRNATNIEEIERFFEKNGFHMVDLGAISLEEKVDLMYHAKIIAGPASSAWSNVIFCNGCKGILLNTLSRVTDSFSRYLMSVGNVSTIMVTGYDEDKIIHTNYTISMDDIEVMYNQLLKK